MLIENHQQQNNQKGDPNGFVSLPNNTTETVHNYPHKKRNTISMEEYIDQEIIENALHTKILMGKEHVTTNENSENHITVKKEGVIHTNDTRIIISSIDTAIELTDAIHDSIIKDENIIVLNYKNDNPSKTIYSMEQKTELNDSTENIPILTVHKDNDKLPFSSIYISIMVAALLFLVTISFFIYIRLIKDQIYHEHQQLPTIAYEP